MTREHPRPRRHLRLDQARSWARAAERAPESNLPAELLDVQAAIIESTRARLGLDFFDVVFEMLDYDADSTRSPPTAASPRATRTGASAWSTSSSRKSYSLRPLEDLRAGHQQRPGLRLPAAGQLARRPEAGDGARLRPRRLLQEQPVVRQTNRQMIDAMANHATRVRRHIDRHGVETVEDFIDACLSLENLIDSTPHFIERPARDASAARTPRRRGGRRPGGAAAAEQALHGAATSTRPQFLERAEGARSRSAQAASSSVPARARSATCCCSCSSTRRSRTGSATSSAIVRDEAYYFAPQAHDQDHERGLGLVLAQHDHDAARAAATPRSSTTPTTTRARWPCTPGRLNPYKLGIELFRDIEDRWNKGQVRQGVRRVRRPGASGGAGTASSASAARRSSRCARSTTT